MLQFMEQSRDNIKTMESLDTPVFVSISESAVSHERDLRLARLAMLIECEGSITIGMAPPTKTRNRPSLYPTVSLTNTSIKIIDEARDTLISEGIGFSFRTSPGRGVGKRIRHDMDIHGFVRVDSVLNLLLPWLNSKKQQAEILLEFIRSRRAAEPKAQYSDREWRLTTDVRKLNYYTPQRPALAKAICYLKKTELDQRSRTVLYYRKYVEMCTELQAAL